jgi:putative hydrolase of the HAD superfamily
MLPVSKSRFDLIAFDADDTLWHNEPFYSKAKLQFVEILSDYAPYETIGPRLDTIELRNLQDFGYGIKSFVLSMVEAAVDVSAGRVTGSEIQAIVDIARRMLRADLELFEHVHETLTALAGRYPLMLITKGDQFEQELKIKRSGVDHYFHSVEIVGDKDAPGYRLLLSKYNLDPKRFLMVGNSLRSDILPVAELGGVAVYIPYEHTWSHENSELGSDVNTYRVLENIGQLPALVAELENEINKTTAK